MSRIGNSPVSFSEGTTVSLVDGIVTVKGKLGELSQNVDNSITISVNENEVVLTRDSEDKQVRSYHGLYRSLIANMVEGVEKGFERKLELVGDVVKYTPKKGYVGIDSFKYIITDLNGDAANAEVIITVEETEHPASSVTCTL